MDPTKVICKCADESEELETQTKTQKCNRNTRITSYSNNNTINCVTFKACCLYSVMSGFSGSCPGFMDDKKKKTIKKPTQRTDLLIKCFQIRQGIHGTVLKIFWFNSNYNNVKVSSRLMCSHLSAGTVRVEKRSICSCCLARMLKIVNKDPFESSGGSFVY